MGHKDCTGCRASKPLDEFRLRTRVGRSPYREPRCKPCERSLSRANGPMYRQKNVDSIREKDRARQFWGHIKRKYKMTPEDYAAMLITQSGRCAICQEPMTKPEIDHSHVTGKVRGLLCHLHNKLLGLAQDDPWTLTNASAYLQERL